MAKEITFYGKTLEELEKIDIKDFIKLIPARQRRSLKKGFTEMEKRLLVKIRKAKQGKSSKIIKTHCRDMILIPEMLNLTIHVYNGKEYRPVLITMEMLGHYLGEFAQTRKKVQHSAPVIGATKSSAALSVK